MIQKTKFRFLISSFNNSQFKLISKYYTKNKNISDSIFKEFPNLKDFFENFNIKKIEISDVLNYSEELKLEKEETFINVFKLICPISNSYFNFWINLIDSNNQLIISNDFLKEIIPFLYQSICSFYYSLPISINSLIIGNNSENISFESFNLIDKIFIIVYKFPTDIQVQFIFYLNEILTFFESKFNNINFENPYIEFLHVNLKLLNSICYILINIPILPNLYHRFITYFAFIFQKIFSFQLFNLINPDYLISLFDNISYLIIKSNLIGINLSDLLYGLIIQFYESVYIKKNYHTLGQEYSFLLVQNSLKIFISLIKEPIFSLSTFSINLFYIISWALNYKFPDKIDLIPDSIILIDGNEFNNNQKEYFIQKLILFNPEEFQFPLKPFQKNSPIFKNCFNLWINTCQSLTEINPNILSSLIKIYLNQEHTPILHLFFIQLFLITDQTAIQFIFDDNLNLWDILLNEFSFFIYNQDQLIINDLILLTETLILYSSTVAKLGVSYLMLILEKSLSKKNLFLIDKICSIFIRGLKYSPNNFIRCINAGSFTDQLIQIDNILKNNLIKNPDNSNFQNTRNIILYLFSQLLSKIEYQK